MSRSVLNSFVTMVFLLIYGISHVRACDIIFLNGFGTIRDIKLIHQWRFNEVGGSVLKDEVCGSDAHIIDVGSNNAVVLDGSVVMLGGDQNNSDYVQLPDGIFSGLKNATIEIWATNKNNSAWSRIFDFGPSNTDYLMMSWNRFGDPNTDQVRWQNPNTSGFIADDTVGNYELNTLTHIVLSFFSDNNFGSTSVYWHVNGSFKSSYTANDLIFTDFGKVNNFLGRSKYPDLTANVEYHEVNVYSGAMTTDQVMEKYQQGPNNNVKVTAAAWYPENEKFYVFTGTQYYRQGDYVDPGYPRSISTFWDGWTPSWGLGDLDAITYNPSLNVKKYYLFQNNEFIVHTHAQDPDTGYPKPIVGNWNGWPVSWGFGELDAVAYYPTNNKFYLFRGNEYVQHSPSSTPDPGYPKSIAGNWSGWPPEWGSGGLDAIIYYSPGNQYYLFKGDEYVRHTHGQPTDPGYPKLTDDYWFLEAPNLSNEKTDEK